MAQIVKLDGIPYTTSWNIGRAVDGNKFEAKTVQQYLDSGVPKAAEIFKGLRNALFLTQHNHDAVKNSMLAKLVSTNSVERVESGQHYKWKMTVNQQPYGTIIETDDRNSKDKPGINGDNIYLVLNRGDYAPGDVLDPQSAHGTQMVRIQETAHHKGGDVWVYTCKKVDKSKPYLDPKILKVGINWFKKFSVYGEASYQGGSIQNNYSIERSNGLSLVRTSVQVTDIAAKRKLYISAFDNNNPKEGRYDFVMDYLEAKLEMEHHKSIENCIWMGRDTDVRDTTNKKIYLADGLVEQLGKVNTVQTSSINIPVIEDFLLSLIYGRTSADMLGGKVLMIYTGLIGIMAFRDALESNYVKFGGFDTSAPLATKVSAPMTTNGFRLGRSFTELLSKSGIIIQLVHAPFLDVLDSNYQKDEKGYALSSRNMYIADLSITDTGGNNISLVKADGYSDGYSTITGVAGKTGIVTGGQQVAHSGAYTEICRYDQIGVAVADPTRCGVILAS